MNAPEIAIVVPTRNRQDALRVAIESVFAQTHQNFELIVVDDDSTDDTLDYLSSVGDPRLKWYQFERQQGGNAARNFGVKQSHAPILSFLDSDDFYRPERISDALELFERLPYVDAQISSFVSVAESRMSRCINPDAIFKPDGLERFLLAHCLFLGGSGISVRRSAFDKIGGFNQSLKRMQDLDLLLRLARAHVCASSSKVNWMKIRSPDSLSHQKTGQISALNALCLSHPTIEQRYPRLLRYLVAREILKPVFNVRLNDAMNAYREARQNEKCYVRPHELLTVYIAGKLNRRQLTKRLWGAKNLDVE